MVVPRRGLGNRLILFEKRLLFEGVQGGILVAHRLEFC
jgi:hypothetical protein